MASKSGMGAPAGSAGDGNEGFLGLVGMVMSHPTRIAILQALSRDGSTSPRAAASTVSVSLGTCSYHMRALRKTGAIRLRTTRHVRGTVEHFYELTSDGHAAVRAIDAVRTLAPERVESILGRAGRAKSRR
jgi:predicted ArsR family transcriptional regulator